MTHDEFADWDAAYVLGALSTTERAAYEEHLAGCPECAAAVRGLAVIPGLLAKVPPEELPGGDVPPPPADLLARTRAAAQQEADRRRFRRRLATTVLAAAAAVVVFAGGALWSQHRDTAPSGVTVAMQQVRTNPLAATLRLHDKAWGTQIDMTCSYPPSTQRHGRSVYALYVVDDAGRSSSISTWTAGPGTTSKLTAATAVSRTDIAQLQVRTADGTVLLSAAPR